MKKRKKPKKTKLGQALIKALNEALNSMKSKAPRSGVRHTKVVPDKTKYTRKKKHKDQDQ